VAGCAESEATKVAETESHAKAEMEARLKAYGPSGNPSTLPQRRVAHR
jgi:hypothetical protein